MRDILFKAKRISDGQWVEGYLYKQVGVKDRIYFAIEVIDNTVKAYEVDESTICQYIGLSDKNGNKIWENDIVEIPTEDEYFHLKWEEDTARFVMSSNSFIVTFDNYWSHEVEVIGNIFDNPELLEG